MTHPVQIPSPRKIEQSACVVTHRLLAAPIDKVWKTLLFYEEITTPPPLLLRWLLPIPLSTGGAKFEVGGIVKCRYTGGYLLKRVTEIVEYRRYAFEIVEQNLALHGLTILGGEYRLQEIHEHRTRVVLSTCYQSPHRPRWLCRRLEALICHWFHRHILAAIENNLQNRDISGTAFCK